MLYRKFADTDIKLSVLGFGTAGIGLASYLKEFDSLERQDDSVEAICEAVKMGVNFFDTAPAYGHKTPGEEWPTNRLAEKLLGRAMKRLDRSNLFIATKNQIGQYEPEDVRRSLEKSLELLGTDYVDLFQIHGANYRESQYSTMVSEKTEKELLKLKEEGLIKFIGISGYREGGLLAAAERGIYQSVMEQYNVFYRGAEWELLDYLKEHKISLFPMRPATGEKIVEFMNMIDPERKLEVNPYHIAMKYVLQNEVVTSIPVGMRTVEEVKNNIGFIDGLEKEISHC